MMDNTFLDFVSFQKAKFEEKVLNFLSSEKKFCFYQLDEQYHYFLHQSFCPDESFKGKFSNLELVNIKNKSMIEIFENIKKISQGNLILMRDWCVPAPEDCTFPAFSNEFKGNINKVTEKSRKNESGGKTIPKRFPPFCEINPGCYQSDLEFNNVLEKWFRGFDTFHGYIVSANQINQFAKYNASKRPTKELQKDYENCIKGFFSGVHEYDTLIFLFNNQWKNNFSFIVKQHLVWETSKKNP